jgi:cytosol alanyl aminopeptidase
MNCLSFVYLIAAATACSSASKTPASVVATTIPAKSDIQSPPGPRLPRTLTVSKQNIALRIDPTADGFSGTTTISASIHGTDDQVWLNSENLKISQASIQANAQTTAITWQQVGDDRLLLQFPAKMSGAVEITLGFSGSYIDKETVGAFKQVVNSEPYIFSQFEATFARRVFPCIDEPDVKVPWSIAIDAPAGFDVISNTLPTASTATDAGFVHHVFEATRALPSYLVAFAVGHFDIVPAGKTRHGVPIRIVASKGRGAEAAYAAQITGRLVEILEDWFALPYPYQKLDLVSLPMAVGFGAMENAGMITFTEKLMLLEPKNLSWRRRHSFANVAAHELAHQWFGNYVTTAWWDDIWLNEGFASWMESKVMTKFDPTWHDELSVIDDRASALDADSLVSARQVREPVNNEGDISNAFDGITYQKGASVLAMFEQAVGENVFQKGVHIYMKKHAYGNATSKDFTDAIGQAAGQDVSSAFATFLDQPGAPLLTFTSTCSGDTQLLSVSQQRYVPPGAPKATSKTPWQVPFCVAVESAGKNSKTGRSDVCSQLNEAMTSTPAPLSGSPCTGWLFPNAGGRGYYNVALNDSSVATLAKRAWPVLTASERLALWGDIESSMRNGSVSLPSLMSMVPLMMTQRDRFTTGSVIGALYGFRGLLRDADRPMFDRWALRLLGPDANKLGWTPDANDDLDAESRRSDVVEMAATVGDPTLRKTAVTMSKDWRTLPQSTRGSVLAVAVDEDPAVFERVMAEVAKEPVRQLRGTMIGALGGVRSLERYQRALALTLDPAIDARETDGVFFSASTDAARDAAESFFDSHFDELMKRLPSESTTGSATHYISVYTGACSAVRRDEVIAKVQKRFGKLEGADREIAQAIEAMDQCIAIRKRDEPQLKAWLQAAK